MIDKITTYDEYLESDEMAKKRHVFEITEEDARIIKTRLKSLSARCTTQIFQTHS